VVSSVTTAQQISDLRVGPADLEEGVLALLGVDKRGELRRQEREPGQLTIRVAGRGLGAACWRRLEGDQ
jgi:hypothetical protein